jgi:hypothetical protein
MNSAYQIYILIQRKKTKFDNTVNEIWYSIFKAASLMFLVSVYNISSYKSMEASTCIAVDLYFLQTGPTEFVPGPINADGGDYDENNNENGNNIIM